MRTPALLIVLFFYSSSFASSFNLNKEFSQIEDYLEQREVINNSISKAPVKWHLLHMLQLINAVYRSVEQSKVADYNPKFSPVWMIVSSTGRIPRGRAKAPKSLNPTYDISEKDILTELEKAKQTLKKWDQLQKNNYFQHPVFNALNKRKTKRFIKIHTRHHLRIIKDILKLNYLMVKNI